MIASRKLVGAGNQADNKIVCLGQGSQQPSSSDRLISLSRLRPTDAVLVFGYNVLDHLVGLGRHGVAAAIGVHGGQPCRLFELVDMVWFTAVSDIESEVIRLLRCVGHPRVVAVELVAQPEFKTLRRLVSSLRDNQFSPIDYRKVGQRYFVIGERGIDRKSPQNAGRNVIRLPGTKLAS